MDLLPPGNSGEFVPPLWLELTAELYLREPNAKYSMVGEQLPNSDAEIYWPATDAALDFYNETQRLITSPGIDENTIDELGKALAQLTEEDQC